MEKIETTIESAARRLMREGMERQERGESPPPGFFDRAVAQPSAPPVSRDTEDEISAAWLDLADLNDWPDALAAAKLTVTLKKVYQAECVPALTEEQGQNMLERVRAVIDRTRAELITEGYAECTLCHDLFNDAHNAEWVKQTGYCVECDKA